MKSAESPRYLIGIDLGTTHTVVAFTDLNLPSPTIELFLIPQLVALGEIEALPLLPSLRYHPAVDELASVDIQLPWQQQADPAAPVLGVLARILGAKSYGRLVGSAKSWLSLSAVDRQAPILPWGAPEDVLRISPVDACASYLAYISAAWNHQHPHARLENQEIVLTVPASFDETARTLTLNAARNAGLMRLHLIEEPQAACYAWLWRHRQQLQIALQDVERLLIVDVGGGTTDLTLIKIEHGASEPKLTRIAVSNHLILGGDNIDLMLAHLAEQQLVGTSKRLSALEFGQLVYQCRIAKEKILDNAAPETVTLTLLGAGSKIIGGARSINLQRDEIRKQIIEGFLPLIPLGETTQLKRSGVTEFGLPYANDPAITRHISTFLTQHGHAETTAALPDAMLLNGGLFRSPLTTQRIIELLSSWRGLTPKILENPDTDTAVALGAVAYGLARRDIGVRKIGGGAARSYFLQLSSQPGEESLGICLLPKGTESGIEVALENKTFALTLGQTVGFHIFSSTADSVVVAGSLVDLNDADYLPLPPLMLALNPQNCQNAAAAHVILASCLTEIGTLEIYCVSLDDPSQRWMLEFQLRGGRANPPSQQATTAHPRLADALAIIRLPFEKKAKDIDPRKIKSLRQELENILGERDSWNIGLLRRLFDELMQGRGQRKRSPAHERLWLNFAGYCLRPGYGDPMDPTRCQQIFELYDQGIQYVTDLQNWAEWWTLWRRIAGGLDNQAQQKIFSSLVDFVDPESSKRKNLQKIAAQRAFEDMLRLTGALERLSISEKTTLGSLLLQRLNKSGEATAAWWALGRVGNRTPLNGSSHAVVHPGVAQEWLQVLLKEDWKQNRQAAFSATLIARMCGDRSRDIDPQIRSLVTDKLTRAKLPNNWVAMVDHVQNIDAQDESRALGETLPPGLKLVQPE